MSHVQGRPRRSHRELRDLLSAISSSPWTSTRTFGRRFGELAIHPAAPGLVEGHPEILVIHADEKSKRVAGENWHSDVSCDAEPPMGSILYMHELPPVGGDTLFASMYAPTRASPSRSSACWKG
jgi:taurine dioxygenase